MPADLINKTKVFGKQYKCLLVLLWYIQRDAVWYENALEQNMFRFKCYIDGSKLNIRAGASFYVQYPKALLQITIFAIWEDII